MGLWVLVLSSPCLAHHGVAPHYDDDKVVELDGVVAKFDFINPHSFVYVEVLDEAGNARVWQCELASRTVLARNGLTADLFRPGERITLEGAAGRKNPTGCALRVAHFPDGGILRSTTLFEPTRASPAELPADPDSIFGVWTMKRFAVSMYEGVLTAAGEQARQAFDPVADDPAIYCDPASPVRFWINVNEPFEIRREGEAIVIDHRFMDSRRVLHLSADRPADLPRTAMGYSTARFEGGALVVSTRDFAAGALEPRRGVMHTADLELTERLEVDAASGELQISWVIDDPAYFKEPLTQTELFVRSRRDPEPYDCRPGYQQ
jgi:hypothetical protein